MEIAKEVDYAPHYLRSQKLLREIYEHLNEREFKEAEELCIQLNVGTKLLLYAVRAQK